MTKKQCNIGLALGLNERYDHRVAIGVIKFSRSRPDWRLFGNDWLFHSGLLQKRELRPDGVIARIADRGALHRLKEYGIPVVDIAGSYDDAELPQVVNDDFLTGHMAGTHLLSLGFQNFAYVGVDEAAWSHRRADGMRQAIRETLGGAELATYSVGISWLRRDRSLGGLTKWLRRLPLPCAVLAVNDLIGYRVALAAAMAGLAIPGRIALMGIDNEEVYCELSQPPLTSITCDCERIGWEAATLLARMLDGEDAALRRSVVPPLRVEPRASTDIVLGEDSLVRNIRNFIRANAKKGINVADVAAAFPLSRRALEKRFKNAENRTIHEEILARRLECALRLLEAGESATAAAYGSGFATVQHFYHAFGKAYRMTPMAYAAAERGKRRDRERPGKEA